MQMLHVRFFWEGRGLVFVFAYFCRGSNMKNQTKKKTESIAKINSHVNVGTECCTFVYSL